MQIILNSQLSYIETKKQAVCQENYTVLPKISRDV